MVVEKTVLVNLMVELGFKHVADMSQEKLLSKLKLSLPKVDEETVESIEDEEAKDLLEKLIELPSLLDKLKIEDSEAEESDEEESEDNDAEEADEEESEDDEEEEADEEESEDDEEEETKAKKGKKDKSGPKKPKIAKTAKGEKHAKVSAKKSKKDTKGTKDKPKKARGTGVIANIVAALKEASKAKPLSKEVLLKRLVKAFPDRAEASMKNTINAQLGYHLHANKGLNVQHNDSGYYLGK